MKIIKASSFFVEFQQKISIFLVPPPQNEPTIKTSPLFAVVFIWTIKVFCYTTQNCCYTTFCYTGEISYK